MSLLIGAEIKIISLIFLRTVQTLQGISTTQKGSNPSISNWIHSLVVLLLVFKLLFTVYILKKFFNGRYSHTSLVLEKVNKSKPSSKVVEITFNEVLQSKVEYNNTTFKTENSVVIDLIDDAVDPKCVLERNAPEIDNDAPESPESIPPNKAINSSNDHKENNFASEPELTKYLVYDSSDSFMIDIELDRIYNSKWCDEDIADKQIPLEKDITQEQSSSVSYHEGEVFSIAINGDPNITNLTAKEAMKPTGRFNSTRK